MDTQVIIVGGGPAGLMLAGELRVGGVDVIVLERLPEPAGRPRGLGLAARTMEVFDQRGLLPRLGPVETGDRGHFGGLPLDLAVLEGARHGAGNVSQARTEAMLAEWAAEIGADIRRGHELTGLTDRGDAVEADVAGPAGPYRLRAPYLAGCDGGGGLVREAAGFDFPGTESTMEGSPDTGRVIVRQVTEYRRGRVLLAGDAAHVQLPACGERLDTGVQDSVNLGWKLAAELSGWAPEGLLGTYDIERHPVGRRSLTSTQAQALLCWGGPRTEPLRELMSELTAYEEAARHLAGMVSGLEIRYDMGPGDHPLLGLRMPKRELAGGSGTTTTTGLLHRGRGVLLDLADDAALRDLAEPWADRIDVVTAQPHGLASADPLHGTGAVFVRPDGHVGWAAPDGTGQDLPTALACWAGPPRAS
ncbi:FAD-dependent monooxygenase [Spirillospora sp. NPDC048911]|uniref:FAD-dependent monooxygenase n=1 Tax=Spirillospora sp. NPDC048911 TaxID=3364527 RepID=UPI00371B2039